MSLRDHLLNLAERTKQGSGWPQLSIEQRFSSYLSRTDFATYNEDGEYIGQTIPFELSPRGLGGNNDGSVGIFSHNDCAERLWSVNAAIQGENVFPDDLEKSRVRIVLLKKNTFFSQWCNDDQERPFQMASVRPSRNLFADPFLGTPTESDGQGAGETEAYARARIQAQLGLNRAEFEDEEFAAGETQELAGRGLYGSYALFLPIDEGGEGLDLELVEDILLRFDDVSVAND